MNNALQQSQEWFEQRKGKVTASRVGAILGVSKYAKPSDVMRDMVRDFFDAEREFVGNDATEYGNAHESEAIAQYEEQTGMFVVSSGFQLSDEYDWLGASLDGTASAANLIPRIIEVKCPYRGGYTSIKEKPEYYAQVQIQMFVSGIHQADFIIWRTSGLIIEPVEFDQAFIDDAIPKLKAFYDDFLAIIADKELSKKYLEEKVVERDDAAWSISAFAWIAAKADVDAAQKRLDQCRAELEEMADKKTTKGCGVQVIISERIGSVNYKNIPELDGVDLEKYRGKASKVTTIRNLV